MSRCRCLFYAVILTLERSEGEGPPYWSLPLLLPLHVFRRHPEAKPKDPRIGRCRCPCRCMFFAVILRRSRRTPALAVAVALAFLSVLPSGNPLLPSLLPLPLLLR
jgi:hypothetical protein